MVRASSNAVFWTAPWTVMRSSDWPTRRDCWYMDCWKEPEVKAGLVVDVDGENMAARRMVRRPCALSGAGRVAWRKQQPAGMPTSGEKEGRQPLSNSSKLSSSSNTCVRLLTRPVALQTRGARGDT
jgi:hypothetical protein